jgi:hypothetical protein
MSPRFVPAQALLSLIGSGEIRLVSHVAAILLALRGSGDAES